MDDLTEKIQVVTFNDKGMILKKIERDTLPWLRLKYLLIDFEIPGDFCTFGLEKDEEIEIVFIEFNPLSDEIAVENGDAEFIDLRDMKELNAELTERLYKSWKVSVFISKNMENILLDDQTLDTPTLMEDFFVGAEEHF